MYNRHLISFSASRHRFAWREPHQEHAERLQLVLAVQESSVDCRSAVVVLRAPGMWLGLGMS